MPSHRVLITGGAGFLGSHLAACFLRVGHQVRLFDQAQESEWVRATGIEHVRGDVRNQNDIEAALKGVDSVIHAAFASPREPQDLIESVNVGGTRNICEASLALGIRRFVLISSTIVSKSPRVHPVFRNSPLTRLNLYRESRIAAEEIASDFGTRGLSFALVRPKTFVGPGRLSAFGIILESVRLGRPVPILGRGRSRYQLLDIRDMAEGIRLLEASHASGIFFFGAKQYQTIQEDLQGLLDHAGTGARLCFVRPSIAQWTLWGMELANIAPLSEWHYKSAYDEDSVVDTSRAEQELEWRSERSNLQALQDAYDWYVASVGATGTARSTHPPPLAHRALIVLSRIY